MLWTLGSPEQGHSQTYLSIEFEHVGSGVVSEHGEPLVYRFLGKLDCRLTAHSQDAVSQHLGNGAMPA